jgi:hypothetical protein
MGTKVEFERFERRAVYDPRHPFLFIKKVGDVKRVGAQKKNDLKKQS